MTKATDNSHHKQQSLEDVCNSVRHWLGITAKRKRDILSDIRCLARAAGKVPADIPLDVHILRQVVAELHPVQLGVTPSRFNNMKSSLLAGIQIHLGLPGPGNDHALQIPEWKAILAQCESHWQRYLLARFIRFCSKLGIKPVQMRDEILGRYAQYLDNIFVLKDPRKICKEIAQTWNGLVLRKELGLPLLTIVKAQGYQTVPLSQYPASFQADLEAYFNARNSTDIFSEHESGPALRTASKRNTIAAVRQAGAALHYSGIPLSDISSLSVLVQPEMFDKILRFYINRYDGKHPPSWFGVTIAAQLVYIAEHYVKLEPEKLAILKKRKSKIMQPNNGMTEKNKCRLRQFDETRNVELLYLLPLRLMDRALAERNPTRRTAIVAMNATAITIFLTTALRVETVSSLNIATDFTWHGKGKDAFCSLHVPGERIKNNQPFEGDIDATNSKVIRVYLERFRALLAPSPDEWLFPAEGGGHSQPRHFGEQVKKAIWRETGLVVNPHLFRAIAVEIMARHLPGQYESARLLLGHRKSETTESHYARHRGKQAVSLMAQIVHKLQKGN